MFDVTARRLAMIGYSRAQVITAPALKPLGASTPRVSVVVPCYNYGRYLESCVDSVLNQEDVDVDVTVVDDCSTDGSQEVAAKLVDSDDRVRAIYHERNLGHIRTFNEGLDQIDGDYAVLLSADDLLTPGSLARACAVMQARSDVGLVYGGAVDMVRDEHRPLRSGPTTWTLWRGHDWIADRCRTGRNALRSPEAVMRTSVLRTIGGGYRQNLPHSGDFEMWLRAARVSDVAYIGGQDQAVYRVHEDNMSRTVQSGARDLTQRADAFDTFFEWADLDGSAHLRDLARRALAHEAMRVVIYWTSLGIEPAGPINEYVDFALRTWPPIADSRHARVLDRLRQANPARTALDPRSRVRQELWRRRLRFIGLKWRLAGL